MTEERKKYMAHQLATALPVMRTALNIKQDEICEKTGICRSVLSGVERGKRQLYWDTFLTLMMFLSSNEISRKLFSAYDIDVEELKEYLNCES